jgi:hypothetical protein
MPSAAPGAAEVRLTADGRAHSHGLPMIAVSQANRVSGRPNLTATALGSSYLTANGVANALTVYPDEQVTFVWNAVNAITGSFVFYVSGGPNTCGHPTTPSPFSNAISGAELIQVPGCAAGSTYTFIYTVTSAGGQSAQSLLILTVSTAPAPVLDLDFVNGAPSSTLKVSRLGLANSYAPSTGTLVAVPSNTPRISADEQRNLNTGLLIEGPMANGVDHPDMSGAAAGVVGKGGTFPGGSSGTGGAGRWNYPLGSANGFTATISNIVNSGPSHGFTLRLANAAPIADGLHDFALSTNAAPFSQPAYAAAAPGDVWTGSIWIALAGPSSCTLPGADSVQLALVYWAATGAAVGYFPLDVQNLHADRTWPYEAKGTAPSGTVAVSLVFLIDVPSGSIGAIDCMLRLESFQLEKGSSRTSPVAATSRAADDITLLNASAYVGSYPWSLVVTAAAPRYPINMFSGSAGNFFQSTIIEVSDGSAANYISVFLNSYALTVRVARPGGPPVDTVVAVIPPTSLFTVAMAADYWGLTVSVNGKTPAIISAILPGGLKEVTYGNGSAAGYWYGYILRSTYYNVALTASQLTGSSTREIGFFDDFANDRNGPLPPISPSGQTYTQFTTNGAVGTVYNHQVVLSGTFTPPAAVYTQINAFVLTLASTLASWSSGGSSGSAALVSSQISQFFGGANPTRQAIHIVFADGGMTFGTIVNGNFSPVVAYRYNPMDHDAQIYGFGWGLSGHALVALAPDGKLVRILDSDIGGSADFTTDGGQWFTFENFSGAPGETTPQFSAVAAAP